MRVTPLVGRKLWFWPRGWSGWGWAPACGEGWFVLAVYVAAVLVVATTVDRRELVLGLTAAATAAMLLVVVLKGTAPGGPRKLAEFRRETERRSPSAPPPARSPQGDENR